MEGDLNEIAIKSIIQGVIVTAIIVITVTLYKLIF